MTRTLTYLCWFKSYLPTLFFVNKELVNVLPLEKCLKHAGFSSFFCKDLKFNQIFKLCIFFILREFYREELYVFEVYTKIFVGYATPIFKIKLLHTISYLNLFEAEIVLKFGFDHIFHGLNYEKMWSWLGSFKNNIFLKLKKN